MQTHNNTPEQIEYTYTNYHNNLSNFETKKYVTTICTE